MKEISQKENEKKRFLVSCSHCNWWHKWNLQKNQSNKPFCIHKRPATSDNRYLPSWRKKERKRQ